MITSSQSTSLLVLLLLSLSTLSFSTPPDLYLKSLPSSLRQNTSTEYIQLTKPLPSDPINPNCSLLLLQADFGNTYGSPPASALYSPPSNCLSPWTKIVLQFSASCQGEQYDRIAGVWLDGVEILRTSTAEPTEAGVFWNVRKDVTRYSSLLQESNLTLTVMLENIIDDVLTGVYHVNVSLHYYSDIETSIPSVITDTPAEITANPFGKIRKLGYSQEIPELEAENTAVSYEKPADLIIPVSADGDQGSWFRIDNAYDVHSKQIEIPLNTYKAVLEVYVSFHGNDEFWYSNPPDSYIKLNNLTTQRGNGAFREVFVTVDGLFVGSVVPFPVIFTGGINPLFWEPVVAIGAFDLPSYDIDLTPFLGFILDGKSHSFRIGVMDSIDFWLVDANLHLWLDYNSDYVTAKTTAYGKSDISIERESKFEGLDGKFKIEAEREYKYSGWVNSSQGNITTEVSYELKFKNSIQFKNFGQLKEVKQKLKTEVEVKESSATGSSLGGNKVKSDYPLEIIISSVPGINDTYLQTTNLTHSQNEKISIKLPSNEDLKSTLKNSQVCGGWMVVQDHSVLSGAANTQQNFSYKDGSSCYSRTVDASNGWVLRDDTTLSCIASS